MHTNSSPYHRALLAISAALLIAGCGPQSSPSSGQLKIEKSAEPTSFKEVAAQLDAGGNLYLYLGTEQWVQGLSRKVATCRQVFDGLPGMEGDQRQNLGRALDLVTNLISDSGLEEVSGFGMSSIARKKGFYHTKTVLHHYPGKGGGFLWNVLGQKPHALEGLQMLPAHTAVAAFSDVDLPLLWSVVRKEVGRSGMPEAEQALEQAPAQFEAVTGLNWDKVLTSLGGEFGFVLTLDDTRMITLPIPGQQHAMEIPEPALMLVAKVKDETLFNRLDEALKKTGQNIVAVNEPGLKMRTVPVPLPLPIQLRPTLASSGGYLYIATTDGLVREALEVKAGKKPGLKSTDEFKRLAVDVPQQGNRFFFLSQKLGKTVMGLQQQALSMAPGMEKQSELLRSLVHGGGACSFTVGAHTEQGCVSVGNGNQNAGGAVLVAGAAPAVLAAVAVPAFVKARAAAQKTACINNLRQIDAAKQQWALEKKKGENDTPSREDLLPYLHNRQFPACPAGGTYDIRSVGQVPTCTQPGHQLGQ